MLTVITTAEDRFQVVDDRGRFVQGFPTAAEAEAFKAGYATGRQDSASMYAAATDGLGARMAGGA